jgi:MerR family transcriptional regulator, light-induced transcriptional regulator
VNRARTAPQAGQPATGQVAPLEAHSQNAGMQLPGQRREAHEAPDAGPTLKVAAVARRLGVAPATLRTWARRYGVGPPAHTAGAHRQYTTEDLSRLLVMRRLTLEGVAPAEAARIALSSNVDPVTESTGSVLAGLPQLRNVNALPVLEGRSEQHRDDDAPGTGAPATPAGRPPPARLPDVARDAPGLPTDVRRMLRAARTLDSLECRRQLTLHIDARGVLSTWEDVAQPVLHALDEHWSATGEGCEIGLAFAQAMVTVLHSRLLTAEAPQWGTALLACAQDEPHDLPLQALAAALAERRVATLMLGPAVPHRAVSAAAERARPKVVLLYSVAPVPAEQLDALPELEQTTRLLVGGPGWQGQQVPDGAVHAPSLAAAVDQVRLAVRHCPARAEAPG